MSEFLDTDFDGLMFNIHRADPSVDYRDIFPELRMFPEFSAPIDPKLDRQTILRYVIYAYDKNSPFRSKYKDLLARKVNAMLFAGYDMVDGKFPSHIEDVLECRNFKTNEMILGYCKLHYSISYRHLVLCEAMYQNKEREVMLNQTSIKMTELNAVRDAYEKAQNEFLQGENSKGVIKSLYASINRERLALAPEDIAKSIKEKGYENAVS